MRKKEFSSFDVAIAVHELKEALMNSRVNNIYQFDAKTLVFKLHKTACPPLRFVTEAGRRMHLTAYALKPPDVPPTFCMALRKHLRGAWIANVEQYEFERIATIYFRTKRGVMRLILELFGEGNIILTGENGEILQALIFKRMRDRSILRHEIFQFPPPSGENPFKVKKEELESALKEIGEVEVVRALARILGVGGVYAEEILIRADIEKTKHCNVLTESEVGAVYGGLQSLLSAVSNFKANPNIVLTEDGSFLDVVPFKLKRYESFQYRSYSSFNEALDEFYLKITAAEKAVASIEVDKLKQEAKRLGRVIAEQEKALREDKAKSERDRCIGSIIYMHSSELQRLLNRFAATKRKGRDWKTLISEVLADRGLGKTPETFIESFDARNFVVNVCIDNLRFSLNVRRTLFENAAVYYERGKKAKQKSAGALKALEKSRRKLAEVEHSIREAEALKKVRPMEVMKELVTRKVKRKKWYEKFRWFKSSDGFLIVAGKDAVSNEVLVKKYAGQDDVVFHADVAGAPFVVIKSEGRTPTEQALYQAGEFATAFSRAWREEAGSADVYWVTPSQLSKSGPSGEYVPHGAFAVSGKRNWMRSVPLKLGIGVVKEDDEVKFLGGPLEAVKAKTKVYIAIVPGNLKGKEFLKQILQTLWVKLPKEQREKARKTSIEQIRDFVPYTKGRVIENVS